MRLPLLLCSAALLAACNRTRLIEAVTGKPPAPRVRPTVVVVSFDAFANRYLDRDSLPHFHRLIANGVRAPFQPEFPSKTFGNHYSMATGLTPGQHGIVLNQFFDPARDAWFLHASQSDGTWFGGEPIWATAEHRGLRTAAYYWMGSEAEIHGYRPTYWEPFNATTPDSVKLGQIMRWLRQPESQRPTLVMMYSPVVDVAGHRYGPDAREVSEATAAADRTVGALSDSLTSLGRPYDLIIVSDHGLAAVPPEHRIDMDSLIPRRGALVDDERATFSFWADPKAPGLNVDSLARALRAKLAPHVRVFQPGQFPVQWQTEQNRRFGDVFLLADPGWEFVTTTPRANPTMGEHGYDPADPSMTGIFIASGIDFQSGVRLPVRENRTLRDLLVKVLRIDAVPVGPAGVNFGLK